ncbi:hypothetical protein MHYP_G00218000 [Metynnis hypsauchen]
MAPCLAAETLSLSRSHGFRCVPPSEAGVEDVLLVVGETVGFDQIYSASRVSKAIVVFLREERLVNEFVESGIWVLETFVPLSPLATPVTRVIMPNVPPFLSSESLTKELGWLALVPLACKNAALKHVLSFRRQVPENQAFNEAGPSGTAGANDVDSGEGTSAVGTLVVTQGEEVSEEVSEDVDQQAGQGEGEDGEAGEEVSVEAGLCAGGSGVTELESVAVDESQSWSMMSVEEGMDKEEDRLSEVSDIGSSQFSGGRLYTVEQLNSFLDETKGRPVNGGSWMTAEDLADMTDLRSVHLASQVLGRLKSDLSAPVFEYLDVTPVDDWQTMDMDFPEHGSVGLAGGSRDTSFHGNPKF